MSQSIALEGVCKSFDAFDALKDIDLRIEEGEFVALVGKSGCGKSTLLRIMAGLMMPTSGTVKLSGRRVTGPSDGIGMAFQTPVLLPWRSVEQNIRLQLEVRRIDRPDLDRELARLIELTGLKGFENHKPYELSGGMQQRVALCRALIHDPSLLLLDEPFGALDAMTREQLNAEIQRIWMKTGKTIVLVTHSIIEAVYLADRVVVLDSGPGRIIDIVDVNVARPRSFSKLGDPAFQEASDRIRVLMEAEGMTA